MHHTRKRFKTPGSPQADYYKGDLDEALDYEYEKQAGMRLALQLPQH